MIAPIRCFMKRVDGGANVERDASIGVGQSNGHEDEGERGSEPPAIAIGVATEKVGQSQVTWNGNAVTRSTPPWFPAAEKLAQGLGCRSSRKGTETVRYSICTLRYSPPSKIRSSHTFPAEAQRPAELAEIGMPSLRLRWRPVSAAAAKGSSLTAARCQLQLAPQ